MDAHKTIQSVFHILGILVILGFLSLQAGSCMLLVGAMSSGDDGAAKHKAAKDAFAFGDEHAEATFLRVPVAGVISAEPTQAAAMLARVAPCRQIHASDPSTARATAPCTA